MNTRIKNSIELKVLLQELTADYVAHTHSRVLSTTLESNPNTEKKFDLVTVSDYKGGETLALAFDFSEGLPTPKLHETSGRPRISWDAMIIGSIEDELIKLYSITGESHE